MRTGRSGRFIELVAAAALVYGGAAGVSLHAAQDPDTPPTSLANALPANANGEYIFKNNCATCHAVDGTGSPQSVVGFAQPFPNGSSLPDFSDCSTNTVEPLADWSAVVHRGGPIRGLDRHMPAFGDALSDEQIESVLRFIWTLCADPQWPRGDLNFPRAFFTEKAFPENEAVLTTGFTGRGEKAVTNELVYEHRIRQRTQYEVVIPFGLQQAEAGRSWARGLGDVELALRRTFVANLDHTFIFAAGGAVALPTGKETLGLGEGVTVWEPFAMFGKGLGANGFLQMHGGTSLPSDRTKVERSNFLRTALGYTLAQDQGFGRSWTPMTEILWSKEKGANSVVDVVPQVQVSLSKLQHVLVNVGVRIPATEREGRHAEFLTYFLWDWFDGGLTQFWR